MTRVNPRKKLEISYRVLENGFVIEPGFGGKYSILYPTTVFNSLDNEDRQVLAENFTYARTRPLAMLTNQLNYQFSEPRFRQFVDYGVTKDLPRISDFIGLKNERLNKLILESSKINFLGKDREEQKITPLANHSEEKAILALSFGKDSLLSYALLKEIGLDLQIVFGVEMESQNSGEYKFKMNIMNTFVREQGEKILFFEDTADDMYYAPPTKGLGEFENTNGMLAFALELMPFAFSHRAKYIVLGNEKNMDDSYINRFGAETYPSFDQSSVYTEKENEVLAGFTDRNIQILSPVEPIYNLAEMKILYNRYPHLLKYMMSCSPNKGSQSRWCYACPMCAKSFLYSIAVNGRPTQMDFHKDLFGKEYKNLYPLFAKRIKRPYEKPLAVREEQLLAFLLAYRLGAKGHLVELFEKNLLGEAINREADLRNRFFGIHAGPSVPKSIEKKLISIYEEELTPFQAKK